MTITAQTPAVAHLANGITTTFAYGFLVPLPGDMIVKVDGVTKTLGADYSIAGVGVTSGGSVTFTVAPTNGARVLIYRSIVLSRSTDYQVNGDLPEQLLDADFDRLWMVIQEVKAGVITPENVLRVPIGETLDILPSANDRKGKLLYFDPFTGQPLLSLPSADTATELRADLGNGADPVQGLGILPFNATLSYSSPSAGAKLKQHATLQDRGAVGDGVTNDAAAIDLLNLSGASLDLLGKTYKYTGTFNPVAKFFNGSITATSRTFDFSTQTSESHARVIQGRGRINYYTPNSVAVLLPDQLVMAGFRFMGSYKKGQGRVMPSGAVSGRIVVNDSTNLAVETSIKAENWYAVFAVCNNSDASLTYVNMPFFRAGSVAGSVVQLAAGGETNGDTVTAITYAGLATNKLVGAEVLVIQEGKLFNGRTTAITANTNGSVTLADVGSIAANDFFLVAPPGWDSYAYLGSWYRDTGEPRNMADTGSTVGSYGVNLIGLAAVGALSLTRFSCAGQVSPFATAALYQLTYTVATTLTGPIAHYLYMDASNHFTNAAYYEKVTMGNETFQTQVMTLPFASEQAIWMEAAGSITGTIVGRIMRLQGWLEP